MGSVFSSFRQFDPGGLISTAILATLIGICVPLAYILIRRAVRRRYFRRRNERTMVLRSRWPMIVEGTVPPETWRFDPLDRKIVEDILLDRLEVAPPGEAESLMDCLRGSGLLDMRIWEAREGRGWRRQEALVSLGRMRALEGIPALSEALKHSSPETRIAALRGLGNTGRPEAAVEILKCVLFGSHRFPISPMQTALLRCCQEDPSVLLPFICKADDTLRPVLVRVLGEVATSDQEEDLVLLASDPLPEVRASIARALGNARPRMATLVLSNLAGDDVWFVRLRAVVALGELRDPDTVPVLIRTLCDPNRHVRIRSASALARLDFGLESVIEQVVRTRDRYALQALLSELERTGRLLQLVKDLSQPELRERAQAALLAAVRAGAHRLLLDTLVRHASWRIRVTVARLLAESRQVDLIVPLERLDAGTTSKRHRRIIQWVLRRLRDQGTPARVGKVSV